MVRPAGCCCVPCAACIAAEVEAMRSRRAKKTAGMKRLHDERRARGVCIQHARRRAYRGGRCRQCWKAKLAAERERTKRWKERDGGLRRH